MGPGMTGTTPGGDRILGTRAVSFARFFASGWEGAAALVHEES